ncbi:hypothetical protein BGZ83_001408, partial [Gryganskiella cystojenkinii]
MPTVQIPPVPAMEPPAPTVLEVNFKRLLAKCHVRANAEQALQGTDRARFQATIRSLRNMLLDLEEETAKTGRLPISTLQEYSEKINSLAQLAGNLPLSSKVMTQTRIITPSPAFSEGHDTKGDSESLSGLRVRNTKPVNLPH